MAVALRESISGLVFLIRSLVKERNIYVRTEISELRIFHFILSRRLNSKWDDNSSLYTTFTVRRKVVYRALKRWKRNATAFINFRELSRGTPDKLFSSW